MTVVTVYSSRLKDDVELVPRFVRDALSPLGLNDICVRERIDKNVSQGSHRVVVQLPTDLNPCVDECVISEALKRLFNHVPPRREVSVKFEAA